MIKKTFVRTAALLCAMALLIPTNTIQAEAKIPSSYEEYMQTSDLLKFYTETDGRKILNEAIAIASKATGAPHEKVKYLHDELCRRVTYDKSSYDCGTSYGALVNGRAKCIGYAESYELLCDLADIPCQEVIGETSGGGHAWNIVQLEDGQWYEVDCTFDDTHSPNQISYNWFLISTEQMNKDHKRDYNSRTMNTCPIANGGIYSKGAGAPSSQSESGKNNSSNSTNRYVIEEMEDAYAQYNYNGANYWVNAKKNSAYLNKLPKNVSKFTVPDTIIYKGQEIKVDKINGFILDTKNKKKLKSITIGSNVKEIQESTFKGCKKLKKVQIKSECITKIGKNAFKDTNDSIKVKVPSAQKKAYKKMLKKSGISKKAKIK